MEREVLPPSFETCHALPFPAMRMPSADEIPYEEDGSVGVCFCHVTTQNRSMPTPTVIPVLAYEDVRQAAEWLCAAFGFEERLRRPTSPMVSGSTVSKIPVAMSGRSRRPSPTSLRKSGAVRS